MIPCLIVGVVGRLLVGGMNEIRNERYGKLGNYHESDRVISWALSRVNHAANVNNRYLTNNSVASLDLTPNDFND